MRQPVRQRQQTSAFTDSRGGHVLVIGEGVRIDGRRRQPSRTAALLHCYTATQLQPSTSTHGHVSPVADYCTEEGKQGLRDALSLYEGKAQTAVPEQEGEEGKGPRRRDYCPVRRSDKTDLHAHLGQPAWKSAYRSLIGGDQPRLGPDDVAGASRIAHAVEAAIARGGWSSGERNRLYKMRTTWGRRVARLDARFILYGNCPGRLPLRHRQRYEALDLALIAKELEVADAAR